MTPAGQRRSPNQWTRIRIVFHTPAKPAVPRNLHPHPHWASEGSVGTDATLTKRVTVGEMPQAAVADSVVCRGREESLRTARGPSVGQSCRQKNPVTSASTPV